MEIYGDKNIWNWDYLVGPLKSRLIACMHSPIFHIFDLTMTIFRGACQYFDILFRHADVSTLCRNVPKKMIIVSTVLKYRVVETYSEVLNKRGGGDNVNYPHIS